MDKEIERDGKWRLGFFMWFGTLAYVHRMDPNGYIFINIFSV
jgi:hypothetical protein